MAESGGASTSAKDGSIFGVPIALLTIVVVLILIFAAVVAVVSYVTNRRFDIWPQFGFTPKMVAWKYSESPILAPRVFGRTDVQPFPIAGKKGFCYITEITGMPGAGQSVHLNQELQQVELYSNPDTQMKVRIGCFEFDAPADAH